MNLDIKALTEIGTKLSLRILVIGQLLLKLFAVLLLLH